MGSEQRMPRANSTVQKTHPRSASGKLRAGTSGQSSSSAEEPEARYTAWGLLIGIDCRLAST